MTGAPELRALAEGALINDEYQSLYYYQSCIDIIRIINRSSNSSSSSILNYTGIL